MAKDDLTDDDDGQNVIDQWLFGPGTCKRCGLIKPLAMMEMPGMHEDPETGEVEGGMVYLHPLDERRRGYCFECAPIVLQEMQRKG